MGLRASCELEEIGIALATFTTLANAVILRNVARLPRLKIWATISLISAVLSWLGISFLYLCVS